MNEVYQDIARMLKSHYSYAEIQDRLRRNHNLDYNREQLRRLIADNNLYNQESKKQFKMSELDKAILSVIKPIECIVKNVTHKPNADASQITLVISDTHIGKLTETYNSQIAINRICWLIRQAAIDAEDYYKDVHTFNIVFAGDIVDGISIYPKQSFYIDNTLLSQVFDGIAQISETIAWVSCRFGNVNIFGTYGNHGRISKYYDELSNVDLMFLRALELGCQNLSNVKFAISNQSLFTFKLGKYNAMVAHGHDVAGGAATAINNRVMRWLATEEYKNIDLFIFGHFHTPINYSCQRAYVVVNGSTVSGDRYAIEKMGLSAAPSQTAIISTNTDVVQSIKYFFLKDVK